MTTQPEEAFVQTDLAPVSLERLGAVADLQARHERKYIVPTPTLAGLVTELGHDLEVLEINDRRSFRYESVYFDTYDFATYHAAARSRPRRFKVRTRTYLDSELCALEVKTRDGRGRTVKHRQEYPSQHRDRLTSNAWLFLGQFGEIDPLVGELHQTLTTQYRRTTLLVATDCTRVTIDAGVCWREPGGRRAELGDLALIEVKTTNGTSPVDRWLWSNGHRPTRISKYGTGLATLHPHLGANKWNRTLRRHFNLGRHQE